MERLNNLRSDAVADRERDPLTHENARMIEDLMALGEGESEGESETGALRKELSDLKITNTTDFDWLSQLRYYWLEGAVVCVGVFYVRCVCVEVC